jgi:hypothetical protein
MKYLQGVGDEAVWMFSIYYMVCKFWISFGGSAIMNMLIISNFGSSACIYYLCIFRQFWLCSWCMLLLLYGLVCEVNFIIYFLWSKGLKGYLDLVFLNRNATLPLLFPIYVNRAHFCSSFSIWVWICLSSLASWLDLTAVGIRCADHVTPSTRKSRHYFTDSGGRSVGIVRLRTKATEFSLV